MRAARLGCFTSVGIIAALATAFAIAGYAVANGGLMFSPGALNSQSGQSLGGVTSHAEIGGACSACHAAPWEPQTMQDRCLVCHQEVASQMLDLMTPHGRMYAIVPISECRDCHPEHRGEDASLTDIEGWRYPHELSGYFLDAHQFKAENDPFKCADCHGGDVTTFDAKTCTNCHGRMDQEFTVSHILAYGDSCLECHDGRDSLTTNFSHDAFQFKLTGKHAAAACVNCHRGAHSLADFKSPARDCASCHREDDPHGGSLGSDCASCHSPDGWTLLHFDHNRSVFKLEGAHVNVACERCHLNDVFKDTPTDCFSCHKQDDFHNGALGQDCASCHKPVTWKDISFDHSRASFQLTGRHAAVACGDCHKDLIFKGVPTACASCHVDVHFGQMGKDCAGCHNTFDWKDVNFDHSRTGFPLTGSHKRAACASCHANGLYKGTPSNCFACHASADAHNGQFGTDCGSCHTTTAWKDIRFDHNRTGFALTGLHVNVQCKACHVNDVFKGTPKTCFACHAARDAHNGQFGSDCASCHNASGWKNAAFDHNKTAFPLTGGHASVQCKTCHVNGVYKGAPKDCYSCHAAKDIHNGQFGAVCSACHTTSGWKNVTFDHGNTAFPLAGSHASAACKSCHVNNVYKGTPKDCYSCHAAKDKHNGQFGMDCGTCHKPTKWSDVNFDHNNTAFPLSGRHAAAQCQACHANGVYRGTPANCYACHASKDAHNGQFGVNCESCHNPGGWGNAAFDHNNTAFPLEGKHARLECRKCHGNGIYQGTPTQCIACHSDKDKHNGANGSDCAVCHTPTDWGRVK